MQVGKKEKKEVSELNHEIYTKARDILGDDENMPFFSHIGWIGVGVFIDWLEANYEIKKK